MTLIELLVVAGNYYTFFVIAAFLILLLLKEKSGATFAGVTAFFFILGTSYFPYLIEWDTERYFRYPIWFFHELSWMATIAYLGLKDRVSMRQSIAGQLLGVPLLAVNFFRGLDYHYMDLFASTNAYRLVYPLCEVSIVFLCWLPIFVYLKNKFFVKSKPD